MTAAPQLSPDGLWWWDGYQWVPAQGGPGWSGYGPPQQPATNDGLGIASLVCSLVWVAGLGSIVGIVLGHVSRARAQREGRQPGGVSLAGIIVGYVGLGLTLFFVVFPLLLGLALFATLSPEDFDEFDESFDHDGPVATSLMSAADAQEQYRAEHGVYAGTDAALSAQGFDKAPGVTVHLMWVSGRSYCMRASSAEEELYSRGDPDEISPIPCSG